MSNTVNEELQAVLNKPRVFYKASYYCHDCDSGNTYDRWPFHTKSDIPKTDTVDDHVADLVGIIEVIETFVELFPLKEGEPEHGTHPPH